MDKHGGTRLRVGIFVVGMLLVGCTDPAPEVAAAPRQSPPLTPAAVRPPKGSGDYVAVVVPAATVEVGPLYAGTVIALLAEVGERVVAGTTLATFDGAAAADRLSQAEGKRKAAAARLRRAKLELRAARRRRSTTRRLVEAGHGAKGTLQDAEEDVLRLSAVVSEETAELRSQTALAALRRRELEQNTLFAPTDGVVAEIYAQPGAVLDSGAPLFRILHEGESYVRFAVPPAAPQLQPGDRVWVTVEGSVKDLPATVKDLAPEIDSASGMVTATAELDLIADARDRPKIGSPARVRRTIDALEAASRTRPGMASAQKSGPAAL